MNNFHCQTQIFLIYWGYYFIILYNCKFHASNQELTRLFALHEYDTVSNMPTSKMNPRGFMICDTEETQLFKLIFAAERGDVYLIRFELENIFYPHFY